MLQKIEQVVRLIRSKGVGIYFITQNPADVPDTVLGQLGNRVQHGLRAYTPAEQKGLKAAADSFRVNPAFDTLDALQQLGTGEAVVSLLDAKGTPNVCDKTMIRPPASRLGPVTDDERKQIIAGSPVGGVYDTPVDRQSAYEILTAKVAAAQASAPPAPPSPEEKAEAKAAQAAAVAAAKQQAQADALKARQTQQTIKAVESVAVPIIRSVGIALLGGLVRGMMGNARRR